MTLVCADCGETLIERQVRGQRLARCPRCQAHFVDATALAALVASGSPGKSLASLVEFEDGTPRHLCPLCHEELHSMWLELLRLERCDAHGFRLEGATLALLVEGKLAPDDLPRPAKKRNADGTLIT